MGCENNSDLYQDSKLVRIKKSTYDNLKTLKEKGTFDEVINKMHLIYINRIVTEAEIRYTIKKELIELLLKYLEKET